MEASVFQGNEYRIRRDRVCLSETNRRIEIMATRTELMRQKENRDLKMIELYNQGLSYQTIANLMNDLGEEFKATRCAVSARIMRLSLQGKVTRRQPSNAHVENRAKKIHNSGTVLLKSYSSIKLEDWTKHGKGKVDLLDLKNDMCRFPFEDGKYCGEKATRKSYCLEHGLVCFRDNGRRVK